MHTATMLLIISGGSKYHGWINLHLFYSKLIKSAFLLIESINPLGSKLDESIKSATRSIRLDLLYQYWRWPVSASYPNSRINRGAMFDSLIDRMLRELEVWEPHLLESLKVSRAVTLAFADHKRSEVRGEPAISSSIIVDSRAALWEN